MKTKSTPPSVSCVKQASSRKSELCVAAITLFLLASNAALHAQVYGITDLGTLPGTRKSVAYGLNDLGQAVGVSSNPTAAIATLFSKGTTTNMNTLGADVSVATAISGSGQAAGYNIFDSNPNPIFRAFLYSNGSMTDIQSDTLFPSGTIAYGINSAGEAVGEGMLTSWTFHPFLYSNGRMVDLGTLGGSQAGASAINDSGEIVGSSLPAKGYGRAFLYSNGKMADLGVPSGAYSSDAKAINGIGQIVGALYFSSQPSHAALYNNGIWTDLGAFPGASGTSATGINTAGQIVGIAVFPITSYHPFKPGKHVGFIYRSGVLVDFNALIPSNSGFTITDVAGINDSGQILCTATNTSGSAHAVLLIPK
jgi:probable HAF family extracellular repeat protein